MAMLAGHNSALNRPRPRCSLWSRPDINFARCAPCPGRSAALLQWCAADLGPFQTPSLERSQTSGAALGKSCALHRIRDKKGIPWPADIANRRGAANSALQPLRTLDCASLHPGYIRPMKKHQSESLHHGVPRSTALSGWWPRPIGSPPRSAWAPWSAAATPSTAAVATAFNVAGDRAPSQWPGRGMSPSSCTTPASTRSR